MDPTPAEISSTNWLSTPASFMALILSQQQENDQLRHPLNALATELANLRDRINRTSRNSTRPPSSDGPGFYPPERRKGSGRKRGGQQGHPGAGPELLPLKCCDDVVDHHPQTALAAAPCSMETTPSHFAIR